MMDEKGEEAEGVSERTAEVLSVASDRIATFLQDPQDERVLLLAVVRRAGRVAVAVVVTSTEMFDSLELGASRSIHADLREAVIEVAR